MMQVATLENCKKLFELSDWVETYFIWFEDDDSNIVKLKDGIYMGCDWLAPAYDLGYLLRKLPRHIDHKRYGTFHLIIQNGNSQDNNWIADYYQKYGQLAEYYSVDVLKSEAKETEADTPEDAAALLAIQLFESGILTKEQEK